MSVRTGEPRRTLIDPGWLFLIAGLMLMAAGVLIPAQRDLDHALWRRDRVLAAEMHRLERLTRYETYIDALRRRDETVMHQLATLQLGLAPVDSEVLLLVGQDGLEDASVFRALEPAPLQHPRLRQTGSILSRLANNERFRLWLLAGSAMLVLIGLLPPGEKTG